MEVVDKIQSRVRGRIFEGRSVRDVYRSSAVLTGKPKEWARTRSIASTARPCDWRTASVSVSKSVSGKQSSIKERW